MNTAALREQIQKAQQHEAETGQLTRQLEAQLPNLHAAIQLPDIDAKGVMTRFVTAYIEQVPDLLDAANEVAREAGIESQIKPVLKIAEQFFLQPPKVMEGHVGLEQLAGRDPLDALRHGREVAAERAGGGIEPAQDGNEGQVGQGKGHEGIRSRKRASAAQYTRSGSSPASVMPKWTAARA